MAVRCSKCGEELLGAVNRCWKCGQMFALHPEIDGTPPVRAERPVSNEPRQATVIAQLAGQAVATGSLPPTSATAWMPRPAPPRRVTTGELIEARRAGQMAMGGTVASMVLGLFAACFALVWPPAAIIAVLGLMMGIWGLYSPRRNWALVGMLICCLAIGVGMYGGAKALYIWVQSQRPTVIEYQPDPAEMEQ